MRIAVVGVGLIGGSIALATREHGLGRVTAWDASPEALEAALDRGAIDSAADDLAGALDEAEVAFVAVPVGTLPATISEVLRAAPADCAVSDVGSTKRAIVAAQEDQRFVGGHPLAGAETSGVAHARADLFEGATWYLTPTSHTSGLLFERVYRMIGAMGARPEAIDAATHDSTLALVSHLPHVLANALVTRASELLEAADAPLPASGPSFRDATRVAGAPSSIWTDIYLSNRDALVAQIDALAEHLQSVRRLLDQGDGPAITAWNEAAAASRRRLTEDEVTGQELVEVRAAVPNQPGVVAELALALGRSGVNIIDLALHPAADMSEGVVALWLPGPDAADHAQAILEKLGHPVFRP
ncbi:MAG TPA: prephenate dehydrogenase/arogenate dehydrogenase family protein [Solirubrobacteraceae bacterium]|jgi:prephenate dehydrogenase|nr:prephenate dehydrogenase/arogenate dehydrogenase family protein [Solirubrobacteraceae bacterium]